MRQFEAGLAPIGESGPGCPYHPLLLCRPAADANDRMGVVSVDEGDVLCVSRLAWVDLANPDRQHTHLLQQWWAPADGPLSAAQALELGFKWHAGPETRRADAIAETPPWMRCRCPSKVFVCCVAVGCMSGIGCRAGWAFGPGGVLLLHREWDWGTQRHLLHRGPRAILCRAVWAEIMPWMIKATRGGGTGWGSSGVLGGGGVCEPLFMHRHVQAFEPALNPFTSQ